MSNDPDTSARTLRVASDGPERTQAFAAALAEVLTDGDLLVLTGDLGAGKTCFTQGLGVGLGIDDRITSPTFTLANRYPGRLTLHHLDVYRLDGEADAADLDLDDLLESGVTVIEWGDRVVGLLPDDRFTIAIRFPDLTDADSDSHTDSDSGSDSDDDQDSDEDLDSDSDLDRRLIEVSGPIGERGLDRALSAWAVDTEGAR